MCIRCKVTLLVLAVSVLFCQPLFGQKTSPKNETLLDATSPFEDIAEFAIAKDFASVTKQLLVAEKNRDALKAIFSVEVAKRYEGLMDSLRKAAADKASLVAANDAIELFRLLIDSLDASQLEVPKEVSLLDYVGFKVHVLTAAEKPDWNAIRNTVDEGSKWWKAIESKVANKKLRDAVATTVRGLQEAAKTENLAMINFAAQIDLDLVDLLESSFEK